ncbi:MAG: MarR family transcriptional regulator [Bacteroidota bacterium]
MNVEAIIKTTTSIPLRKRTIIHMQLVYNKMDEELTGALKPYEVSLQQFNVLRILRGQKGHPANLSTLNERMVSKMSNTTRLVDKLLAKGFVRREVCAANRRKVEIYITPKGSAILEEMDTAIAKAEDVILQQFTNPELLQLNTLLDKF